MAPPVDISLSMQNGCHLPPESVQKSLHKQRSSSKSNRCEYQNQQAQFESPLIFQQAATTSGRALPSAARMHHRTSSRPNCQDPERVLLIVEDDDTKGGGIPVIGRRVPSKSVGAYRASIQESSSAREMNLDYHHPASIQRQVVSEYAQPYQLQDEQHQVAFVHNQPIVIGRRSHRIQQSAIVHAQHPQYELYPQAYQANVIKSTSTKKTSGRLHQQPLSIIETQPDPRLLIKTRHLMAPQGSSKNEHKVHHQYSSKQQSYQNLPNDHHDLPLAGDLREQQHFLMQNHRYINTEDERQLKSQRTTKGQQLVQAASQRTSLYPSSSYSSLCSTSNEEFYPPCCSPNSRSASRCTELCCQVELYKHQQPHRSASCQRIPSCCLSSSSASTKQQQLKKQQRVGSTGMLIKAPSVMAIEKQQNHLYMHEFEEPKSVSRRQNRASSNHHSSCRANVDQAPGIHHGRSSSCHNPTRGKQPIQQAPLLISGRNMLLPKSGASGSRKVVVENLQSQAGNRSKQMTSKTVQTSKLAKSHEHEDSQLAPAVTQMYESLAAELKAKLGDPKMGPILLPPKDYDTMSRKQGKLTGIELRRSTNPQLVGPAVATSTSMAHRILSSNHQHHQVIEENQALITTSSPRDYTDEVNDDKEGLSHQNASRSGAGATSCSVSEKCDSARSSARSQDERSLLRRSRSNSSSGLSSISVREGSPNSSPSSQSSSSEDMRQSKLNLLQKSSSREQQQVGSTQVTREATSITVVEREARNSSIDQRRKNCSPDNCGSSDSGHSEGGPMDSAGSSSEYQSKLVLNDNMRRDSAIIEESGRSSDQGYMQKYQLEYQDTSKKQQQSSSKLNYLNAQNKVGIETRNSSKVSEGTLWNGRVEVPLKVNSDKNGNTYLATKQIIY